MTIIINNSPYIVTRRVFCKPTKPNINYCKTVLYEIIYGSELRVYQECIDSKDTEQFFLQHEFLYPRIPSMDNQKETLEEIMKRHSDGIRETDDKITSMNWSKIETFLD